LGKPANGLTGKPFDRLRTSGLTGKPVNGIQVSVLVRLWRVQRSPFKVEGKEQSEVHGSEFS